MSVIPSGHRGRGAGLSLDIAGDLQLAIAKAFFRGTIRYVNSAATGANSGSSWTDAYTSLNTCAAACAADDTILVAPLHVETVTAAAGLDLNTAGLTIIGLGNGNRCPQINFTTVVGADCNIDGAGITMVNLRFTGGFDALTGPIDVNAADFTMIDCITEDVTGQATDFIVTDANADRLTLIRWTHRGAAAAGADTAVSIVGGANITIEDPWIDGNFAVGCIENVTTAGTNLRIFGGQNRNGYLRTRHAADILITLVATTTGDIGPGLYGRLQDNAANITECLVGAAMQFFTPLGLVNTDGERSMDWNGTQTADL